MPRPTIRLTEIVFTISEEATIDQKELPLEHPDESTAEAIADWKGLYCRTHKNR